MNKPQFLFGDIVVVNGNEIGVVLKTWHELRHNCYYYNIYNRMTNEIEELDEVMIERYRVRHKYLSEDEIEWQRG